VEVEHGLSVGTVRLCREGDFVSYAHTQLTFFLAEEEGGSPSPAGGALYGPPLKVFSRHGASCERDAKARDKMLRSHELWIPLRDELKRSVDPSHYPWVRKALLVRSW
jgi:hypothetical protein